MATLQDIIAKLNDEQKLLLADTIVFGGWGDTNGEFNVDEDSDEWSGGFVYLPDGAWRGQHFERKTLPAMFKALYDALDMDGNANFKTNGVMNWHKDWWDDGSGSVLIIRDPLYKEFEKWANALVKQYNSTK